MTLKVIKFEATWCAPCKALTPIWNNIAGSIDDVDFEVVDIDDDPDMTSSMSIRSVPTIIFMKDGLVLNTMVGLQKEAAIRDKIEELK